MTAKFCLKNSQRQSNVSQFSQFKLSYLTDSKSGIDIDDLLVHIGLWLSDEKLAIYVYDGYWKRDLKLWDQVKKATWDEVILDPKMKKALVEVANKFFDNKDIYDSDVHGGSGLRGVSLGGRAPSYTGFSNLMHFA
jgi:hypothetical protein